MKQSLKLPHTDILPAIIEPLLIWYHSQSADRQLPWRLAPTPYHTWLSEIMLQQTRASAVIPYYERFLAALPDITALANCEDEQLMKLWQGLGYYSRARNLKKSAIAIQQHHHGDLPQDFAGLLALPGIGRYTASAIGAISWGRPWPAVDGNILRVVMRVLAADEDIAAIRTKTAVEQALAPHYPTGTAAGDLNQAFMDLGASICLPHGAPHCPRCPLRQLCLAHDQGEEQSFPFKAAKKTRRIEQRTILLLVQDHAVALHQRPAKGLLAGLWEFPNLDGQLNQPAIKSWLKEHQLTSCQIEALPPARHVFSHVEWQLTGWRIELTADADSSVAETDHNLVWAARDELAERYSLPSAFHYYLPCIFR